MMISRLVLVSSVALFGFTGYAAAQQISEGSVLHVTSKGKAHVVKLKPAHHEKMMAAAHPLPNGAVIYRSKGQLYLLENKPGATAGKTMLQEEYDELGPDSEGY